MDDHPRLRPVETFPVIQNGQQMTALRDPEEIAPSVIAIQPVLVELLGLFNGRHSVGQIAALISARIGRLVSEEIVRNLISQLDEALFLDNEHFRMERKRQMDEFKALDIRPAVHAGQSYIDNPSELETFLEHSFAKLDTPAPEPTTIPVKALVAPHIDLARGAECFARSYSQLKHAQDIDVFIILGIAHAGTTEPFTITDKSFDTPLGIVNTNRKLVSELAHKAGHNRLFRDEFAHRQEHSIEFQAMLLKYVMGDRPFSIVPILCGSLYPYMAAEVTPTEDPAIARFLDTLKQTVFELGSRGCVIAGIDLSHVGGRFRDSEPIGEPQRSKIALGDKALIEHVLDNNHQGVFDHIVADNDSRKVCGYPALYAMLHVLDGGDGKLLMYQQHYEAETDSVVSFCSMVFN